MILDFEVGDLLELEPQGQAIRAVEIKGDTVLCKWISKSGTLQTAEFPKRCLRKRLEIDLSALNIDDEGNQEHKDIHSDWEGFVQRTLQPESGQAPKE